MPTNEDHLRTALDRHPHSTPAAGAPQSLGNTEEPGVDQDFAALFARNPQLAMRNTMSTARRSALGITDPATAAALRLEPGFGPAFDEATSEATSGTTGDDALTGRGPQQTRPAAAGLGAARVRQLPGLITYNRTSVAPSASITARPSKQEHAWLLAAERLTHDLHAIGMPNSLGAQADAFAVLVEPVKTAFARHGLDRRGAAVMEAAARYAVHFTQPERLRFLSTGALRRWFDDQRDTDEVITDDALGAENVTGDEMGAGPGTVDRLLRRPRVLWAHPDGPEAGLLIDRFHHTSIRGLVGLDSWARRKVAEDMTSIGRLLAESGANTTTTTTAAAHTGVLGVRVLTHRAPNTGLHFVADLSSGRPSIGEEHRIGGCRDCRPRLCQPNTSPDARPNGEATNAHPAGDTGARSGRGAVR
ncbi:hypothetical protein [Nocardioides sp. AX2bis]|uniref:hypothetical protein n=1 Tax=Nocardioides sp. AX2bis TaxID=2653157 RepID=UPI0012F3C5CB|nr:hypothetical protein [Nocardioides sp. AX2bis]VXC26586.1 hypothetical protein NOCARDAX2BIS_490074 [Nocardioides sp. AX2bis]